MQQKIVDYTIHDFILLMICFASLFIGKANKMDKVSIFDKVIIKYNKFLSKFVLVSL